MASLRHSRLTDLLRSSLNLQPGEGVRVGLMVLYSAAALGGVYVVGYAVAGALFISRLPASDIPYIFILRALSLLPTLLIYNRIAGRFRLSQMAVGTAALLLLIALAFRVLLSTPHGDSFAVLVALFMFIDTGAALVIVQFWTFAGQIFNPREARRLFGLIAVGGTLANIMAGFSLAVLVRLIGVENLLFIIVGAFAVCLICAAMLGRMQESGVSMAAPAPRPASSSLLGDLREIARSPLLIAIAGFTALLSLLICVGAYQFYLALQATYGNQGEEIAAFLGGLEFWAGIAALFVQLYLVRRVMGRYGAFVALLLLPLGMALGAILVLLTSGALLSVAIIRSGDRIFRRTTNDAALNVLYLPLPSELRQRAKRLIEGVYGVAVGIAGLSFLAVDELLSWTYLHWAYPLLGIAAVWLLLLGWARRQYLRALAENVSRRQLDLSAVTMDVTEEATARVLAQALTHHDELRVLYALKLISDAPEGNWRRHVMALLEHPSPEVRLQALDYLMRHQADPADAERLAKLLEAPEEEVRAAALGAYGASAGEAGLAEVRRFLNDPRPRVGGAAAAALMVHGGSEGIQLAAKYLDAMLTSRDPAIRREGTRALGLVADGSRGTMLLPLFDDPALEVQQGAVHAAGMLCSPECLPHLFGKLNHSVLAPAASEAIAAYGMEALPALAEILQDVKRSGSERVWAVKTLERLGGRDAVETLLAQLCDPDGAVRLAIYRSLAQLDTAPLIALQVKEALFDEVHAAYRFQVLRLDLHATVLLEEALKARFDEAIERTFLLLALRYPDRELKRTYAALQAGDAGMRAMAIELLDSVLEQDLKLLILPLLEAPAERALVLAQSHFNIASASLEARLKELAISSDSWLRACAIYEIGALGRLDLLGPVLAALLSDEPLLRETALASCRGLLEPSQLVQLLKDHAANDPSPTVSVYARMVLEST